MEHHISKFKYRRSQPNQFYFLGRLAHEQTETIENYVEDTLSKLDSETLFRWTSDLP